MPNKNECVVVVDGEVVGRHYVDGDESEAMWIGLFLSDPFQIEDDNED